MSCSFLFFLFFTFILINHVQLHEGVHREEMLKGRPESKINSYEGLRELSQVFIPQQKLGLIFLFFFLFKLTVYKFSDVCLASTKNTPKPFFCLGFMTVAVCSEQMCQTRWSNPASHLILFGLWAHTKTIICL